MTTTTSRGHKTTTRVRAERKKAQETSMTSLGPQVSFFLFTHFIFILLTKFLKYYFKLLMTTTTTTERPPPLACEPLAHRVDCGDDETTGGTKRRGGKRNDGEGDETMGNGDDDEE
jgi:hypothetical protein